MLSYRPRAGHVHGWLNLACAIRACIHVDDLNLMPRVRVGYRNRPSVCVRIASLPARAQFVPTGLRKMIECRNELCAMLRAGSLLWTRRH